MILEAKPTRSSQPDSGAISKDFAELFAQKEEHVTKLKNKMKLLRRKEPRLDWQHKKLIADQVMIQEADSIIRRVNGLRGQGKARDLFPKALVYPLPFLMLEPTTHRKHWKMPSISSLVKPRKQKLTLSSFALT